MMIEPKASVGKAIPFMIMEVELSDIIKVIDENYFISAVSHEKTADLLSGMIGKKIKFNRCHVTLKKGDKALVIIPDIRTDHAGELTNQELINALIRCFIIEHL